MADSVNLWPLIGVAVIIVGFVLRFNPMLIVAAAAIITGFAAHFPVEKILTAIGSGFLKTRNIPLIILLPLAVIGLLERHGLRERAQMWISSIKAATAGRLLIVYLFVREITAAVGLTGLGGHPQMVRPLLAPMAEGATEARYGKLSDAVRHKLRAYSAATDNVGLFFGEDIFVAFGAIVLMVTFLKEAGIVVEPMHVAVWGIPTAICAFLIHGFRLWLLDRRLARELDALTRNVAGEKA
ncbi:membrane protein [Caballeronia peredens]|nr:membrane protein [Caballeronia peredens]